MMDIVTLTCPSCGGKLQIGKDLERFACEFCGNEHVVKRGGGVVSLAPVMDSLAKIEARVDKAESELAVRRLREEIAGLDKKLNNADFANMVTFGIALIIIGFISIIGGASISYIFVPLGLTCVIIGVGVFGNGMKITNQERKLEQVVKEKKAELKHHESFLNQQ
ncbi:MAG: hypothetical protein ACOYZ6_05560 [Chloroflexota bacterium]